MSDVEAPAIAAPKRPKRPKKPAVDPLEKVHLNPVGIDDVTDPVYHCRCRLCTGGFMGELRREDGTKYSRLERRAYYSKAETDKNALQGGHIAKTPLHVARFAIQNYSQPGDWVLDPTIGAGTTAVEAIVHGRNVFGVEIQFIDIVEANIAQAHLANPMSKYSVTHGDARELDRHLDEAFPIRVYDGMPEPAPPRWEGMFSLVVNNPPYSGDESMYSSKDSKYNLGACSARYSKEFDNLAFGREGKKYWDDMTQIYSVAAKALKPGGHFVVGIKDQIRDGTPDELHRLFGEVQERIGLELVGVAVLPHTPTTMFMNTYPKKYPDRALPRHQSVTVFRKPL